MASSPMALSKESVLEIVNHKGFNLIIIRHTKKSRFGRFGDQKIVCFLFAFEHKVNERGIWGSKGPQPSRGAPCPKHSYRRASIKSVLYSFSLSEDALRNAPQISTDFLNHGKTRKQIDFDRIIP